MTCAEVLDRLDAYLAGALGEADRAAIAAHLSGCPLCAADRQAAERLAPLVAGLPRARAPRAELWDGIARRLRRARSGRVVAAPIWAIAAALVVAVGTGAAIAWIATRSWVDPRPETGFVATETEYTRSIADLAAIYARRRDSLPSATRALIERNLAIIERAILEARAALEKEPANRMLEALVLTTYQRELDFLAQAARVNGAD